jgi:4'-phosphopantetheinyl transferase
MPRSARPYPEPGDIHVWWIDLDRIGAEAADTLTDEEQRRAARFRRAIDGARWTAARAALRQILGGYTGIAPRAVCLTAGAWGKPALAGETSLCFSLAHAANRAALAVSRAREVGIDLEPVDPTLDLPALLAAACTPAEAARIGALADERRGEAFLTLWTLKEAYLKATGTGLTREPRSFSVSLSPDHRAVVHDPFAGAGADAGAREWSVRILDAGAGWVAALAVAGAEGAVRDFGWPPPRESVPGS